MNPPPPRDADFPFGATHASADFILRSSDGTNHVDFFVHKLILSMASHFYKTMFTLPPPSTPPPPGPQSVDIERIVDGVQYVVLPVSEDAETTLHFLHHCYPYNNPPPTDPPILRKLLRALHKFDMMDRLSHHVNTLIAFLARERPATAFAIAHLFKEKLGPAARDAAYLSLRRTSAQITQEQAALAHDDTELQHAFNRLIRYRQSCTSCARSTADNVNRISCYDVPGSMEKDWCSCPAYPTGYKPGRGIERYPMWVRDFMEGCKEVLEETPHPDMMLDARLYIGPVKTAAGSGCARCRVTVDGLPLFGARLAKKVALALEGHSASLTTE